MVKLVTWNVNSIGVRLPRLLAFLEREKPDTVCLQELKCLEEKFPLEVLQNAGYHCSVSGQKTYNGVAILSKEKPLEVTRGLNPEDPQARFIKTSFAKMDVICVYVPNGQEVGSEKYSYKLDWLARLEKHLKETSKPNRSVAVCGDFNIALEDKDVHDPELWRDKILFSEPEKKALRNILDVGFQDTFRVRHPDDKVFTWWDYRQLAFPKNLGLRIDLILGSPSLVSSCTENRVDRNERKGVQPSDHAPVIAELT